MNVTEYDPPKQREWIVLDDSPPPANGPPPEKLVVLNWNILCDKYVNSITYGYAPQSTLDWEIRSMMILNDIRDHNADIVCLQEVDRNAFEDFFSHHLSYNGYKGIFWPKTRVKTMDPTMARLVDGCATFFKKDKFVLLDKSPVEFNTTALNRQDMKGEHDVYNRIMPRDHVALIAFLESRRTGSRFIVVNVHNHWDPAEEDVKLIQTAMLMEETAKLADKWQKLPPCLDKKIFKLSDEMDEEDTMEPGPSVHYTDSRQIPLLVCGDFNSAVSSGVYELLAHGTLAKDHTTLANRSYGDFTKKGMGHPFTLKSSYGNINELAFTNYTPTFKEVLEYIWYSTNTLQITGLLGDIDKDYIQRVPGFPHFHFPSDHLPLLVEFLVKPRKELKVVEADFGPSSRDRRR